MIHIGTCGFSYEDWRGKFYPQDLPSNRFLEYYSRYFSALEVNYTYYQMPAARTIAGMVANSKQKVTMAFKLHGSMTHERSAGPAEAKKFIDAIQPARDAGVLGPLLAQFPYSFKPSSEARSFISNMVGWFSGYDLVVEFRNSLWVGESTFDWLMNSRISYCCVDEPRLKGLIPPKAVATGSIGYVRFHGRNAKQWWDHDRPEQRYDYLYSLDELKEWTPKIKQIAASTKKTFVFMNNHYEAKAVTNAQMLFDLEIESVR
jgi:uncharacterized protein YecE (DUF72 family)